MYRISCTADKQFAAAAGDRAQAARERHKADILTFMPGKVAKWWMPDDVVFVDEIPHTATGKIQKITLRQRRKDYVLPSVQAAK